MPVYYYTPLFDGMITPAVPDDAAPQQTRCPGMADGSDVVPASPMPGGIRRIHYDDTALRSVVEVAAPQAIDGWTEQTKDTVDADYPGEF